MPNSFRLLLASLAAIGVAGCATPEADPDLLLEADDAIALAERAGAPDHAPLELDRARELRHEADVAIADDEPARAARLVQRAALQARLAIVRAEGGRARADLDEKRSELERLRDELRDAFGDAIEIHDEQESQP